MKARAGVLTVGSLRGQPQGAPITPRRVAYVPSAGAKIENKPRRCCGSGCADCPVGRKIRARRGLPIA